MVSKTATYTSLLREYLLLTKPGVVMLVLITTLGGMYIGAKGNLDPQLVPWTLIGTGLAAAGSAVLNMVFDRDIDKVMERTSERPLPKGTVNTQVAVVFGLGLILLSFIVLITFVNLLSAFLAMLASFSYVVIYTMLLKRRTPIATEIGGISGALPPVIGYAAATGQIDLKALVLFLIMFMWQPPHFWALAIKYKDDYRKAGVPTLPVSRGVFITKVKTLLYTASLLPLSVLPYVLGMVGHVYLVVASALSVVYILLTLKFLFSKREEGIKLFLFSIIYLSAIFGLFIVDLVKA